LVHFKNRKELETWLQKQPRAVSVALAARAALRALPVMQKALLRGDYRSGLVLPVFRATAVSWAAAKYPAHEKELASAAHAAAGDATYADVRAAATAADAAAYAAHSVNDPANANASRAATAAANAYVYYANDAEEAFDALWSTISTDATFRERGRTASKIAGLPLWPNNQPDDLESSWQEMKNVLHGANEDWQVWTTWYDDRLAGRVQEEERELAYVRIDDNLWLEGPGIVNAEIKRRIEELEPSPPLIEAIPEQVSFVEELIGVVVKAPAPVPKNPPTLPVPIEKVPSALSFGWSSKGTISVVSGTLNWPVSPFQGGERDHANRLEACRALAADTARSLRSGKWNARSDYAETLDQYLAYLPVQPEQGNFLLADAEVRIIRSMFAAEQDFLPRRLPRNSKCFSNSTSAFAPIIPPPKTSTSPCDRDIWNARYRWMPSKDSSKACGTIRRLSSSRMSHSRSKASRSLSPRFRTLTTKRRRPTARNRRLHLIRSAKSIQRSRGGLRWGAR
jgi:hypothetical protein